MAAKENGGIWKNLIARMKQDKKFEAAVYIALLMLGLLLYLLIPQGEKESKLEKEELPEAANAPIEGRLEDALCRMRGVGEVKVMVTYDEKNEYGEDIYGVIVIAEGAQDIMVRTQIQSAVQTVLNVDVSKINVFEMDQIMEVE